MSMPKDFATSLNTWPALLGYYPFWFLTSVLVEIFLQVTPDPGFKDVMYFYNHVYHRYNLLFYQYDFGLLDLTSRTLFSDRDFAAYGVSK